MDHLKRALVLLPMYNGTHTPVVGASRGHALLPYLKLFNLLDLARHQVQLDGVVHLDIWVRVANSSPVVGCNVRDSTLAEL